MNCAVCSHDNPETNKFCGQCGNLLAHDPIMRAAIQEEIKARLKDRDVVEVEIAEQVYDRLTKWGKAWLAVLAFALTILGVGSFEKLLKAAQDTAASRMTETINKVNEEFKIKASEQSKEQLQEAAAEAVKEYKGDIAEAEAKTKAEIASANKQLEDQLAAQKRFNERLTGVTRELDFVTAGAICDSEIEDFRQCHSRYPSGCSRSGIYDKYLNFLKNHVIPSPPSPNAVQFLTQEDFENLDTQIPSGITRVNHAAFKSQLQQLGEGKSVGLIGFLYYYEPTGAESSNCELTGPPGDPEKSNVDYHIGIGFDATTAQGLRGDGHADVLSPMARRKPSGEGSTEQGATPIEQTSVIVEMTPHTRAQFQSGVWTLENLQKAVGRQVRVIGQLLIDNEHNSPSDNCATASTPAEKSSCWRFSIWELHPVERFEVCAKATNDCTQDDTDNWKELNQI